MTYWVKTHREGRAIQQGVSTAKAALELGKAWAAEAPGLPVRIEKEDRSYPLDQFEKNVIGGVEGFGDA